MRNGSWLRVVGMLGLAVWAAACGKVQAKTPGPAPPLTAPEPPARLLIPVPIDPPPVPVETLLPTPPTRPPAGRGAPPPAPTPTPTADPAPPPVLQPGSNLKELEARAKDLLDRAEKNLARVTRTTLGNDAKAQYDSAASFISLAKGAIKNKNFVYAHQCADRAATLAGLLAK